MSIFEMSKNSTNFHAMGIGHFGSSIGMNVSIYVNLRSIFFFFFFGSGLRDIAVRVISPKQKSSVYGMKGR